MSKRFEDLTISDDYMFYHVMQDESLCRTLLNSILSTQISEIEEVSVQKSFDSSNNAKGIRLDVWVKDKSGKQYDIEMQAINKKDLARRMRYYQSAIDSHLMERGRHYEELNDSFIIFICPFDYMKKGLPVYTFKTICSEDREIELKDGSTKIIVNSSAAQKVKDINLKAFLEFMNGKESDNDFVKSLKNCIDTIKHNNRMREEYMYRMTIEDEVRYEARKQGIAQGMQEGRAEGISQGAYQNKCQTAVKMKESSFDTKTISEITGLSPAEIEKL